MANKYSSVTRTLRGRNVFEGAVPAPGTDLSIGKNAWTPTIINRLDGYDYTVPAATSVKNISEESNMIIRRAGLFSNFADGLVQASVAPSIDAFIRAAAYTRGDPPSGAATFSGDSTSKTLTLTAGAIGDFSADDVILITEGAAALGPLGATFRQYAIIASVDGGAGTITLYDYPKFGFTDARVYALTAISESSRFAFVRDMIDLNYMYDVNQFITPLSFSTSAATDIVILGNIAAEDTQAWHTDTIAAGFEDDVLFFDLMAEIEFTRGPES